MQRLLLLFALLVCSMPSRADSFYTLVGFACDKSMGRLTIHYRGAYNDDGAAMVQQKSNNEWEPGELIASMKDDDHIGSLRTIQRSCKIGRAVYAISIGPTPGNWNIQGRCGASISAWVEVRRNGKVVLPHYELEGDCHDLDTPVTTEIGFEGASSEPVFRKVLPAEFSR